MMHTPRASTDARVPKPSESLPETVHFSWTGS